MINFCQRLAVLVGILGVWASSSICAPSIPVIFIHGHGADVKVENSWDRIIKTHLKSKSRPYFGPVYEKGLEKVAEKSVNPNSIFMFGFYRDSKTAEFLSLIHI